MARLLHHQNRWSDQPVEENLEKYNPGLSKEQLEMQWKSGHRSTSANLCACNEAQITREIRKLHLRWWHAGRVQMEKVLTAARVPAEVIRVLPKVIDTCKECSA